MSICVSQPDWPLDAGIPDLLISRLSHLGLLAVTGEQGRSFIHGQVTTDISSLTAEQWRWGAHCDPKGKMLSSFRTSALGDALILMMPRDTLAADLPQLKKYAVFSKAELVDVSDDYSLLGIAGAKAATWLAEQFPGFSPEQQVSAVDDGVVLQDGERFILVLPKARADALCQQPPVDASAWQELEILAAYPNLPASHMGQFVPQMCNLQAINGISFTKGCYMGQETVARMKYRGGNKRALYILKGKATVDVTPETTLEMALDEGFRKGGSIIEAVQRNGELLLTAVLANDTEVGAKFRIADDENSELTVLPLPYSLEEQE
ncbi:tRNA-modifying protein YgfZ [Shewanella algae]|uniref:tRNA-modifying protein ygfZ n=1 Tax=Shewanella algae TaxID=38313 RepID=A0A380AA84_9GAMM|nr:tRNA-modifying protein YgfZ [Shewanella algae]MBO2609004.1 tRNA-modifying protein YgfZ [Shewanella algae]SUI77120.1 tRNA-modifying protein ygfZ [Shewanella algae]